MPQKLTRAGAKRTSYKICLSACCAALTCFGTFILVPLPIGFFNTGDIFLLTFTYIFGIWGAAAAAIGAAAADIFTGFGIYAPATLLIKFCTALCAHALFKPLTKIPSAQKKKSLKELFRLLSSFVGEAVMVAGYFLYEFFVLGYGAAAISSILGNTLQAAVGMLGTSLLCSASARLFAIKNFGAD